MSLEKVHDDIDKHWPRHLRKTRELLRIPSVSMTGEGIEDTAEALSDMLDKMGTKVKRFKASKDSHPLVAGDLDVGADTTALLYGMYDVQPAGDIELWNHPPFGAKIIKQKPFGEVLINRGVYNSKASLVGTLLAIETMLDRNELPINLHFLLEGEEELGGQSFPKYIHRNKAKLSEADVAFGFDYSENANGVPVIALGMKGCMYLDLSTKGSERGGPMNGEIHSSDAVIVESPVWRLLHAMSSMVDENQDPAIDGIWDDVEEASKEDLALVRKLAKAFDPDCYARESGVKKFKVRGSKEKLLKKYLFEPSLNIDGFIAGYNGEGSKTVLPDSARAKIDIRLVPNMSIDGTYRKVANHLKKRGFTDVEIGRYEDYPWTKVSVNEKVSQACIEAMRYHGKEPEVWPLTAGSAPFYLFDQFLGVPWGGAGLGHGGKAHAPNEFAVVKGMRDFEKSVATVFWKYAESLWSD
ncbi:MAG: M20/M25/M40 family metallo-hydrolase [Methanobacteriota archaeon]|nr:MAG: M20/M25/M40 family metallo-hydrolase [Euryarchaeota archaeon]